MNIDCAIFILIVVVARPLSFREPSSAYRTSRRMSEKKLYELDAEGKGADDFDHEKLNQDEDSPGEINFKTNNTGEQLTVYLKFLFARNY